MRSLTVKLTLSFLFVGVIGAVLVAVILALRTRQEFERFVDAQNQQDVVAALTDYYETNGNWDNVHDFVRTRVRYGGRIIILDVDDHVLSGPSPDIGKPFLLPEEGGESIPLIVNEEEVGAVFLSLEWTRPFDFERLPPERLFLNRVNSATILSAAIAGALALVLGIVLARTLTRPIHALTNATQSMAAGNLGEHVVVRSKDEIGKLATSFNQMSSDLARASQLRKQLTADIAHDLGTPLSILRGYLEGLKAESIQGDPHLYTIMHEEVIHLQHLVEDLRILSLADAGELPLNRRAVDPKALLERSGLAYVMQAEAKGIGLRIEAEDTLPSIAVDVERMTQVLNNLVANALRFTEQGEIVLSATNGQGVVELQVKDSGIGIPAEDLPYIFNRFYRADRARQRTPEGSSGLGLAIAKAIVEAHGGQITAVSTPYQSTQFTITLTAQSPFSPPVH